MKDLERAVTEQAQCPNAPIATLIRLHFTLGVNKYTYIKTIFEINL